MASKVVILTTGGTIDKEYPRSLGGYAFEFGVETAAERIAKRAKAKIKVEKVCAVDSQDMTDSEREILLSKILQNENTNFVVTHGTDTLIETALFLKKHIPFGTIVLIGAKLPEVFKDSDADFNLGFAIGYAQASASNGAAQIRIAFNGETFDPEQVCRGDDGSFCMSV